MVAISSFKNPSKPRNYLTSPCTSVAKRGFSEFAASVSELVQRHFSCTIPSFCSVEIDSQSGLHVLRSSGACESPLSLIVIQLLLSSLNQGLSNLDLSFYRRIEYVALRIQAARALQINPKGYLGIGPFLSKVSLLVQPLRSSVVSIPICPQSIPPTLLPTDDWPLQLCTTSERAEHHSATVLDSARFRRPLWHPSTPIPLACPSDTTTSQKTDSSNPLEAARACLTVRAKCTQDSTEAPSLDFDLESSHPEISTLSINPSAVFYGLSHKEVLQLANSLPNLRFIQARNHYSLDNLLILLRACPKLQELDLSIWGILNDQTLKNILTTCPNFYR